MPSDNCEHGGIPTNCYQCVRDEGQRRGAESMREQRDVLADAIATVLEDPAAKQLLGSTYAKMVRAIAPLCGFEVREVVHACDCGAEYTRSEWLALEFVGLQCDDVETLELRNCRCGSTRAIVSEVTS